MGPGSGLRRQKRSNGLKEVACVLGTSFLRLGLTRKAAWSSALVTVSNSPIETQRKHSSPLQCYDPLRQLYTYDAASKSQSWWPIAVYSRYRTVSSNSTHRRRSAIHYLSQNSCEMFTLERTYWALSPWRSILFGSAALSFVCTRYLPQYGGAHYLALFVQTFLLQMGIWVLWNTMIYPKFVSQLRRLPGPTVSQTYDLYL